MSPSTSGRCHPFIVQNLNNTTIVKTIVHWQHKRGGEGHCLARAYFQLGNHELTKSSTVLLSEIRSNSRVTGMGFDFGDVANALASCFRETMSLRLETVPNLQWIAHYGSFSSYDAIGEDSFTQIQLVWNGWKFEDLRQEQQLSYHTFQAELKPLGILELESVYQALKEVGWTKHNE